MALPLPDPPLGDGVILLRPWYERDVSLLARASEDEYVALIEHLPVPFTEEAARRWIAEHRGYPERGRGWSFAIAETAAGEAVGGVGIVLRHVPGVAEAGAWLLQERRNAGLGTRAARLLCGWALTAGTGVARVQATVEPWNRASQRVLEKAGFVREGLLRGYAAWRGERADALMYSLLQHDVEARERPPVGPPHRGAAAVVLDGERRVLLVRWRREPGYWGLPGGRVDPGEAPHETAVRETREETGLAVRPSRLVGTYAFDDEAGRPYLLMDVFLCDAAGGEATVRARRELAEVGWFDPRHLPAPLENVTPVAVPDALAGSYGLVRLGLPARTTR